MSDKDIAKDRADWLLDAVACATQNRQFLRGDPAYDEVAGEAILLNGEKAINVALSKKDAEITRLRAALADAHAVGFAAGVEAAAKRCDAIAGNTADFNQYHRRAAGQCGAAIRAIAGATEMTDSTSAKLRELRERVAGLPCYDGDGDPAGPFDFQIFVRREDVLRLIDAMIQEAGE